MEEFSSTVRAIRFGIFEVDLRAGELRKRGIRIKLQGRPFSLLLTLLKHRGELVTREELRRTLWPEDTVIDLDHSLGTGINKLREILGLPPPAQDSLRHCRGEATGSSLQSRLSARARRRRKSIQFLPVFRRRLPETSQGNSSWMISRRRPQYRGKLAGRFPGRSLS
jgi:hypothetical protein